MTRIQTPQLKKRRGAYFCCETCSNEFYLSPSYLRKAEKRGVRIRFCSMKCYDKTGDKNPFWGKTQSAESISKMTSHPNRPKFTAEKNPNLVRFGTEYGFRGSRSYWWRNFLMREVAKSARCGFADKRALQMHHNDRNRKNNERSNLILLCANSHTVDHYEHGDGIYHFAARKDKTAEA